MRLFLMEDADIVVSREGPGIGALTATPADTLTGLITPWMTAMQPMEVVLSGMAGSRNGLLETPYALLPVDRSTWSHAAQFMQLPGVSIAIAAGLQDDRGDGACDVMRGEET
ncbi:MAG: 2-dehydro-3-deoxygalactonokinase, partial [Steroidobacteraceae bacterium]